LTADSAFLLALLLDGVVDVWPHRYVPGCDRSAYEDLIRVENLPVASELKVVASAPAHTPCLLGRDKFHALQDVIGNHRATLFVSLALPLRSGLAYEVGMG
jgi:hypothetical protein